LKDIYKYEAMVHLIYGNIVLAARGKPIAFNSQQLTHTPLKESQITLISERRTIRTIRCILWKGGMNPLSFDTGLIRLEFGQSVLRRERNLFARTAGYWIA